MDIDELLARLNEDDPGYRFFVIADAATFTETDHPFTLVDTQRVRKNRSLRPLSGYLKYWDVYGHESYTEYLAALSEKRQVLFFEFSLTSGDPDNHWRAILDPSTLRVLAAERWIKRSA
ncbi:hypothetical protein M1C57_20860 [Rhodococcus pyridinivorans]|uniref:hypothetical protein n=1 Tax=Rhodococcus pyridinivorans TaxID=103816 RepID=UPI00200AD63D|nr:hypothetical protein [Rhodococcus pyridinivorans]UPW04042.1 hypothetical protein M1C57_20860 [Rhodococcus pyridinivorans]